MPKHLQRHLLSDIFIILRLFGLPNKKKNIFATVFLHWHVIFCNFASVAYDMNRMRKKRYINKKLLAAALLLLLAAIALTFIPPTKEEQEKGHAQINYRYAYVLESDGQPVLYFSQLNDVYSQARIGRGSNGFAQMTLEGQWVRRSLFWPWGNGQLLVPNPEALDSAIQRMENINENIDIYIDKQRQRLISADSVLTVRAKEMDYYLDIHDVTDEGYNTLATYAAETVKQRQMTELGLHVLDSLGTTHKLRFRLEQRFELLTSDNNPVALELLTDNPHKRWYRLGILPSKKDKKTATASVSKPKLLFSHALPDSLKTKIQQKATRSKDPFFTYNGETKNGRRHGHGIYRDARGNLYDGFWVNGLREGFGCGIDSTGRVSVGEWKADHFRGERMTHHPERIYGIDIARYQHEYNGRINAIGWSQMRLWSLGTKTQKKITGDVDYPVSFCFIKSTQGTEIVSDYFRSDYQTARSHGIRVGAYHFYSKKGSGREQAHHFLQHTLFRTGDLPPVLDLEPSNRQIEEMGGEEKMFAGVREWLNIVEEAVGVRPILYVNQMFVNNHLSRQADLKQNYLVWIARYGEFRPDMKLAFWQLAADGRVHGINRTVDVNVFNGYKDQWKEFCDEYCIK